MRLIVAVLVLSGLCACSSTSALEANRIGAENECAVRSASLSQYNDCTQQVEDRYRDYRSQRQLDQNDDGLPR